MLAWLSCGQLAVAELRPPWSSCSLHRARPDGIKRNSGCDCASCRLFGRLCKTPEPIGPEFRAAPRTLVSAYAPEPVLIRPPVPMLTPLEPRLPRGEAWRYEPKLDGFRGLLWHRTTSAVELLSRNGRDLGPWFPELIQAGGNLPMGTLIDGEIVIADNDGRVDFTALQVRLSRARKQVPRTTKHRLPCHRRGRRPGRTQARARPDASG
jgi:ATP dependent DNA ligase domain